ncbi:MAG: hypothetical protein JST52_12115 [Bacteroidetes bacterium]|nr:hypothetical protein [Bacteroidota bacterium]MBS1741130.1 hypothetical protein [Bacteroidota bacterium]
MINLSKKARFLKQEYTPLLLRISPDTLPQWGKMNPQQMVEHMIESVAMAYGNPPYELITPADKIEKIQEFLKSEADFKPNTANSLLPENPRPTKLASYQEAVHILQDELNNFFTAFDNEKKKYVLNPFFGELDYGLSIQLLYKHSWHHLRQFGLELA